MKNFHLVFDRLLTPSFYLSGIISCMMLFVLLACKNNESIAVEHLYGKWDIVSAEKNGKETNFLRNGYFIINDNGTMTVNITGSDENGKFTIKNNKLMMEGDKTFEIQSISQDSLTIKFIPNSNAEFLIYVQKKNEDVQ